MAGIDNLKPLSERTPEEQRDFHVKGGKASVKKRRFQKRLRDALNCAVKNDTIKQQIAVMGMETEGATNEDALVSSLLVAAIVKNDVNAIDRILELIGESPKEQREADRTEAQIDLAKAKAESIRRASGENVDVEDDGFIKALDGKIDNTEWNESET